jgi:hypothetical protein
MKGSSFLTGSRSRDRRGGSCERASAWAFVLLAIAIAGTGCTTSGSSSTASAAPAQDVAADLTFDGLQRVKGKGRALVWMKPGLDLANYHQILIAPPSFHYKAVRRSNLDDEYAVPESRRDRFETLVTESFESALSKSHRYTIATVPGPQTLLLLTELHDIVSNMPPQGSGRDTSYVSRIGEATVVLELRDSESNEVLARAAERRGVDPLSGMAASNAVSAAPEIRAEARRWGTLVRERLDALNER